MVTKFPFYPPDVALSYERYADEYRFAHDEPTPWMPLKQEVRACKLGVITTSALRHRRQPSFAIDRTRGTAEFREIDIHEIGKDYVFDLTGLDLSEANRDLNVLVPIEALVNLAERRLIRELDERWFAFAGHCEVYAELQKSAAGVADELLARGVDIVFLFTAGHLCNQTAGLIARELEKRGLSTACLITIKEVAHEVRIPRSLFINFPFGKLLGPAGNRSLQDAVVRDMLQAIRTLDKPGKILELPYRWEGLAA